MDASVEFYIFEINQPKVLVIYIYVCVYVCIYKHNTSTYMLQYLYTYTIVKPSRSFDRIIHFNEIYSYVPPGSRSYSEETFLRENLQSPLKKKVCIHINVNVRQEKSS